MPHLVWGIHEHYHITSARANIHSFVFILQRMAEVYQVLHTLYFLLV